MNEIIVEGNSGCKLDIIDDKIFKYTNDNKYVNRLKEQCVKQKKFFDLLSSNFYIQVPKIFNESMIKDGYGFYMQYFHADSFVAFFENYDIQNIVSKIDIVLKFIDENINTSVMAIIDKRPIEEKMKSLHSSFLSSNVLRKYVIYVVDILQNQLYLFDKFKFPLGNCHGDLTFSNILFKKNIIVLIDFLDNFIETPMQDIVKLRQDTRHKWSLNMIRYNCDRIKLKIILDYLDCYIHKHFLKYDFYKQFYYVFQEINLLRILPYAKTNRVVDYIINEIDILKREIKI